MSTDKGYIKVYRDIRDHWIWQEKPYGKAKAWIDLLMLANHEEKKILFEGQLITVGKGQHMTSLTKLAERWGWSRSKVKRFLDVLKSEQMCNTKRNSNGTLITVINYGFYQDTRNTKRNTRETLMNTNKTLRKTLRRKKNICLRHLRKTMTRTKRKDGATIEHIRI